MFSNYHSHFILSYSVKSLAEKVMLNTPRSNQSINVQIFKFLIYYPLIPRPSTCLKRNWNSILDCWNSERFTNAPFAKGLCQEWTHKHYNAETHA